jgi:hypothetical protein
MAKKAAKRKTKRASAGRKAKSKVRKGYRVPMQAVAAFTKMLEQEGRLDEFIRDADTARVTLAMDEKCIAFVKEYLDRKQLQPVAASTVRRSGRDDPCPCIRR